MRNIQNLSPSHDEIGAVDSPVRKKAINQKFLDYVKLSFHQSTSRFRDKCLALYKMTEPLISAGV